MELAKVNERTITTICLCYLLKRVKITKLKRLFIGYDKTTCIFLIKLMYIVVNTIYLKCRYREQFLVWSDQAKIILFV